jgi:hypothetical protein
LGVQLPGDFFFFGIGQLGVRLEPFFFFFFGVGALGVQLPGDFFFGIGQLGVRLEPRGFFFFFFFFGVGALGVRLEPGKIFFYQGCQQFFIDICLNFFFLYLGRPPLGRPLVSPPLMLTINPMSHWMVLISKKKKKKSIIHEKPIWCDSTHDLLMFL